jgi:hypothetical protein
MNQQHKIILGISITILISLSIFLGFDKTHGFITSCQVKAESYVQANYSDTDIYSCTDMNGDSDICTDTDYWDKPASEVFYVNTIDGSLSSSNVPDLAFVTQNGFYNTPRPKHNFSMSKDFDFDNFSFHNPIKHTVYTMKMVIEDGLEKKVPDFNNKPKEFYSTCNKIRESGTSILIKTWYGFSYNAEEQVD